MKCSMDWSGREGPGDERALRRLLYYLRNENFGEDKAVGRGRQKKSQWAS